MSKSWTPEELAAASAAMKAEGHMSYEEFCAAPVLRLEHRGRDSWGRPVYECDGRLYVDVDPRRSRQADICTKQGNAFDGEPCDPVPEGRSLSLFQHGTHGIFERKARWPRASASLAAVGELQHALYIAGG